MVDAEDLRFVERRRDLLVQRKRRLEVVPEWLLDHEPGGRVGLVAQPSRRERLRDRGEERRRDGEVEDALRRRTVGIDARDALGERLIQLGIVQIAPQESQPRLQTLPRVRVYAG